MSLCHMSFRYVSVIGWNPKKIPLGTTTLPENTHEPHMEATTPNPRAGFLETWVCPHILGQVFLQEGMKEILDFGIF